VETIAHIIKFIITGIELIVISIIFKMRKHDYSGKRWLRNGRGFRADGPSGRTWPADGVVKPRARLYQISPTSSRENAPHPIHRGDPGMEMLRVM
jgi:hypothetical protein